MPAGVVEYQHDVYVFRDGATDFGEVFIATRRGWEWTDKVKGDSRKWFL
jgi:hypothetical protein